MEKQFWLRRWDNKQIEFHQAQVNENLVRFIPQLELPQDATILVPLCGKSLDMHWLAQQGYRVVGVELSQAACQAFFEDNDISYQQKQQAEFTIYSNDELNITLYAGDLFQFANVFSDPISAIYDRAALVALPEDMRRQYVSTLSEISAKSTKLLLISATYNQKEMDGPPFSVTESEINRLFTETYRHEININKVIDEEKTELPPHLVERGLTRASEQVYLLN